MTNEQLEASIQPQTQPQQLAETITVKRMLAEHIGLAWDLIAAFIKADSPTISERGLQEILMSCLQGNTLCLSIVKDNKLSGFILAAPNINYLGTSELIINQIFSDPLSDGQVRLIIDRLKGVAKSLELKSLSCYVSKEEMIKLLAEGGADISCHYVKMEV